MRRSILATGVAAALLCASLHAQQPSPAAQPDASAQAGDAAASTGTDQAQAEDPRIAQARAFVGSLKFQSGEIAVPGANAHLHLGDGFRYLAKADTRKVLEQLWNNPPDDDVLGMIVPASTPLYDAHAWAVVITRTDEGHVSDEDAAKTDYTQMLKDMQEATTDGNADRKKAGYSEMSLVGWAEPPRYDATEKKLYWARELSFSDADQHTLNYDIRVLGRTGYLSLNAVAGMNDIATVRAGMQQLLPMVAFDPGQRYADFNPGTDRLAAYGVAALVAGGIAAKAGLFAKLGVILLAAKKFIILGIAAIAGLFRKLFGGKDKNKPGPTVQ